MTQTIIYKEYKILKTGTVFCTLGLVFTTLAKAKKVIDATIRQIEIGVY